MWMRGPSGPFEGCGQIWLGEGWLDDWRRLITVENCILTPLLLLHQQRAPTNWLLTCKAALMLPTEWEILGAGDQWCLHSPCSSLTGCSPEVEAAEQTRAGSARIYPQITAKGLFSSRLWSAAGQNMRGPPKSICGPRKYPAIHCHPQMRGYTPSPTFSPLNNSSTQSGPQMLKSAFHQALIAHKVHNCDTYWGMRSFAIQSGKIFHWASLATKKEAIKNVQSAWKSFSAWKSDRGVGLSLLISQCAMYGLCQIRLSECDATCLKMATCS